MSLGSHHLHHHRQELPSLSPPTLEHRDLAARLRPISGWELRDHPRNQVEPVLAVFNLRQDLVLEETDRQAAQFGHRLVTRSAAAGQVVHPDGAGLAEEVQALTGGAFANAQALDYLIHGQGSRGQEQQSVELGVGAWHPNDPRKLHEQADHFRFQAAPSRVGSRWAGL